MEKIKVGINGYGRIGKMIFRILLNQPHIEIVGINDPMPKETLLYLMKYDTIHGSLNKNVSLKDNYIEVEDQFIKISHETTPKNICWGGKVPDLVIESSGFNKTRQLLLQHISVGTKKVILTCPAVDEVDKTIIIGVNEGKLQKSDNIISNASCTSNCAAPLLKVINNEFGIETAFMNTVHPYTNNQCLIDSPHKDLRRGRTAAANIIPTSSSSIRAILDTMPELEGRFDGIATRVPIPDGAMTELVINTKSDLSVKKINQIVKKYSETKLKGIISYCEDPIVSGDVIGNSNSCIFDSLSTKVLGKNTMQIVSWYDNECGYSNRIVDLIRLIFK